MTLAIASTETYAPSRRPIRRGWRPTDKRPFPTLGWLVLDWTHAYLPSPANEKEPLTYTDEQALRILEWYRLDPVTGRFVHGRRLHMQDPKGWGKSPLAGSLDLAEFRGPVCFDGWDADGQPVGVPWGTGARPAPWIQVAAVSEAQTRNTYAAIYAMLVANDHRAARDLRIDDGRTRLYLPDVPDAILEPVTASAGSREGQRVTKATLDEPQLWFPSNGGHHLVDTILGNLTKMSGRAVFTGNAYIRGKESVAERFDFDEPGVLRYARCPSEEPQQDWPRERLITGLREVYADARWIEPQRIVDDSVSPTANWERMKRLFWNIPSTGEAERWMSEDVWQSCSSDVVIQKALPVYAMVTVDHDHRALAVAIAQRQGEAVALRVRHFEDEQLGEGDYLELSDAETYVLGLRKRYPALVMGQREGASPRAKPYPMRGPLVGYNGSFFQRSAQMLRRHGMAMVDVPASPVRLAAAAEQLMELATSGKLVHDGDPELAAQMRGVEGKETNRGWALTASQGHRWVAVRAGMGALHLAMTAPPAPRNVLRPPRVGR